MKPPGRTNALLVCGLALFFSWAFFFLKHDPQFRDIIPFADDPYDAVGSFAVIAANLLAAVSLIRVFSPRSLPRDASSRLYISRTQSAVALCILMTVSTDAIAMMRHTSKWTGAPGAWAMLALLLCLSAASFGALLLVCRRAQPSTPRRRVVASAVFAGALLFLWFYPEALISRTFTHLLTIDFGGLLLFAPVTLFVLVLLPGQPSARAVLRTRRRMPSVLRWTFVVLLGLGVGFAALFLEIRESAAIPVGRLLLIASVYAYCGLSGLLIAYAFLRKPLGFLSPD